MTPDPKDVSLDRDVDGNVRLTFRRRLHSPVGRVWRAITDPDELSQWYPLRVVRAEMRLGGEIEFVDEDSNVYRAAIRTFDVERRMVFCEEESDLIEIELTPSDDGTTLTFTHTFASGPPPAGHAAGWHLCLDNLSSILAGQPPMALERDVDLERAYEAHFDA